MEFVVWGLGDRRLGCWVVLWLVICLGVRVVVAVVVVVVVVVHGGGGWVPRQQRSCQSTVVNVTTGQGIPNR